MWRSEISAIYQRTQNVATRSGATLVEQIILCHSEITGAGELPYIAKLGAKFVTGKAQITKKNIWDFRNKYLIELRKRSQGRKLVTDKCLFITS